MSTNIPFGSPLARKVYSVGLFSRVQTAPGFMKLISGEMPSEGSFAAKAKGQTSADYPVVKAGDLSKGAGDTVSVDLFNILSGKPVMGDKRINGRMMPLTSSSMDVSINQYRGGADAGGRMAQKRTTHNLRTIAGAGLQSWMTRLEDQQTLVHLAGARGTQQTADWVVPDQQDQDFAEIMVNPVKAPTRNRYFAANDATGPDDIGTNDALTLQDIDRIVATLREAPIPLQAVKVQGDDRAWNDPLWVAFVTERQWLYMQSRTTQTTWRQAMQNAFERKAAGVKHPLFDAYETIMWNGVLIKRMNRYAIRFAAGAQVIKDTGGSDGYTYTESIVQTAADVDRAIILGAQALAKCYGKQGKSDYFYDWSEEEVDHGNQIEIVAAGMGGASKVRFKIDGQDTDYGVAVIDSYAPDPASAAGRTLLNS
ncbi:N4-gp56 family major capsid protein [Cupriavidus metallidurans]|uniref:N4-gp56 family major capsid protein n=1 Tax=Cupriavidus metallidurans TaxID=119219 RepID=UPI000691CCE4|nr:N4-gp56 family major capsid protein [Cupriavidus metallidurans]MDE4918272.1 N4-gp56 family major capsid protein [Cupriavidus metallidurans]